VSAFERYAIERIIDKARVAGVDVPVGIGAATLCHAGGSYAARQWAADHPDEDDDGCCWGAINSGPADCVCWVPVFGVDQATPRPPGRPEDLTARPSMCGDCAFRPGSPERSDEWSSEALYASAARELTPPLAADGLSYRRRCLARRRRRLTRHQDR
jgi:hypothetical protein